MVQIREVKTKKQQREFMNFPLDLYEGNPYFVPPLWMDEKGIFDPHYAYYETCEAVYYNAYRDGKVVGRISGILQKASNAIRNEKRVRFTRFDSIDDLEVAKALFDAVEGWAIEKGMDTVCGPLGFSDLEREGLLIEGFDQLSTFEEQYNAPYYKDLIEACGYGKEVDWTERQIRLPADGGEKLQKAAALIERKYHLKRGPVKNTADFLKKYADSSFDILDISYAPLYGTVPFSPAMKKMMIRNFKLLLNVKYGGVVINEAGEAVGLGFCFPSIAKAVQKSRGHLTPAALVRILRSVRHPEILDLGLIGVYPQYKAQGAPILVLDRLAEILREDPHIQYAETNLNLEDNVEIQNLWDKRFSSTQHKRRRSFVKVLQPQPADGADTE